MSTKRLAIRGVVFSWLGRFSSIIVSLLVMPIIVNGLGDVRYGIWALVMSLSGYYGMVDLGLRGAGTKYIAQYEAIGDRVSINRVVITTLLMHAALASALIPILGLVAWVFPYLFGLGTQHMLVTRWIVVLTGLNVGVQVVGYAFGSILHALKRFDISNTLSTAAHMLEAASVVLVLKMGGGLLGMAVVILAVGVTFQLVRMVVATRLLGGISFSRSYFDKTTFRTLFRFGGLSFISGMLTKIVDSSGKLLVAFFMGPAAVAYYAIADSVSEKVRLLGMGISGVAFPIASQLEAQERKADLARLMIMSTRALTTLSLFLATVFILLGRPVIQLWIGPQYVSQSYPILCVLAVAMVVRMSSTTALRPILQGLNRLGILNMLVALEVLITVALGAVLLNTVGLTGMAIAVLVAQLATSWTVLPAYCCRILSLPLRRFLLAAIVPAALASLPGWIVAVLFNSFAPATKLSLLVLQIISIAGIAALSGYFLCLDRQTRSDVFRSFHPAIAPRI